MAEKSPETQYHISDSSTLQDLLVENGWTKKPFSWLDIPKSFKERPLTKWEISTLASTLNNLKTTFEANTVLNSLTRGDLVAEIGTTYTFKSLKELCVAMDQRDVKYPKSYLQQTWSSFVINFGAPRSLTKDKYEKLITDLASITDNTATADAERGEIIRAAFNEAPAPMLTASVATPVVALTETTSVNEQDIKTLKTNLEKEANTPLTIASLNTTFEKLKDEKNPDNRAVITSYIWSKLNNAGYIMTLNNGTIALNNATDKSGAIELQTTIQSNITAKIVTISDLQRAMVVGPMSFGKYLETQTATPALASTAGYATFMANKLSIDLSKWTPDEQVRRINSSKWTPEEKALLVSYVNGGLKDYNITPEIQRQIAISKIAAEIQASPVAQAVVAQVNTISNGGAKAEAAQMKAAGEEPLTLNSILDNPMKVISKYPWTSLGVVLGSIYKLGFMKTLMILFGGFIGYKVVDELGWIDALKTWKKKETPASTDTTANAPKSVPKMDHAIDISKKWPHEQKLWTNLQKTKSITNVLDNRSEKLGTYMTYIDQNNILDKTLGDLVYTDPHDQSIFSNKPGLPAGLPALPAGVDPIMLKRILRVLISGIDKYPATDVDGNNHTKNYKEWVLWKTEADKTKDDDWKKKKITDIVTNIATKF
jgi:hypothetical protein